MFPLFTISKLAYLHSWSKNVSFGIRTYGGRQLPFKSHISHPTISNPNISNFKISDLNISNFKISNLNISNLVALQTALVSGNWIR